MTDQVVYRSQVRIERVKGPFRRAYLPIDEGPTYFGVHSEIAERYGVDTNVVDPHNATLDYLVAAAAGWLTGTFGGALEARQIPASEGRLVAQATGEIELDGKVMVVRRIHVRYHLQVDLANRETVERVLGFHADFCPVARTLRGCVEITTSLVMEDPPIQAQA